MKISLFRLMPMFLLCCAYDAAIASGVDCAAAAGARHVVQDEFLVNFVANPDKEVQFSLRSNLKSTVQDDRNFKVFDDQGLLLLRIPGAKSVDDVHLREAVRSISEQVTVLSSQHNQTWRGAVGDPPAPLSLEDPGWALRHLHAEVAWTRTQGDPAVVVAVVDSGIDVSNDDFRDIGYDEPRLWRRTDAQGRIVHGASFHNGTQQDYRDEFGHGTLVAGIIGGRAVQGRPGGVAQRLQLMAVRVLDARNTGTSASVANGIRYAVDQGASIINLSLQSECDQDDAVRRAIEYAQAQGRVVVAAAGNDDGEGRDVDILPSFPAALGKTEMVAVGATDQHDSYYRISRFGDESIDLGAPGKNIHGPMPGNYAYAMSGTSFAAPLVSGALVLLAPLTPGWKWSERADYVIASVRKPDIRLAKYFASAGVLDLDRATSAPVVVQSPVQSDAWRVGDAQRVAWRLRNVAGACRSLDVWLSVDAGTTYLLQLATGVDITADTVSVPVPAPPAATPEMKGRVRLTCQGTDLHAYSDVFAYR